MCHTKGYRIITRETPHIHIGYFNPDMLIHGQDCLSRFRIATLYEDILYMPVRFSMGDEVLGTIPNTLYAFQQN